MLCLLQILSRYTVVVILEVVDKSGKAMAKLLQELNKTRWLLCTVKHVLNNGFYIYIISIFHDQIFNNSENYNEAPKHFKSEVDLLEKEMSW